MTVDEKLTEILSIQKAILEIQKTQFAATESIKSKLNSLESDMTKVKALMEEIKTFTDISPDAIKDFDISSITKNIDASALNEVTSKLMPGLQDLLGKIKK